MCEKLSVTIISLLLLFSGFLVIVNGDAIRFEEDDITREFENREERRDNKISDVGESIEGMERDIKYNRLSRSWVGPGSEGLRLPDKFQYGVTPVRDEKEIPNLLIEMKNYELRDPIRIDRNEDFTAQGWPGDGSEEDPYLIEGYEIDGGGYGYSIYIGNVTNHFEVRECYLHNASGKEEEYFRNSGLYLYNTTNGTILDNSVSNNEQIGIYLKHARNTFVNDNSVFSNVGHGILIESGSENTIVNNTMTGDGTHEFIEKEERNTPFCPESVLVQLEEPSLDTLDIMDVHSALRLQTDELANRVEGRTDRIFTSFNMAQIRLDGDVDVLEAVNILKRSKGVLYAEANYLVETMNIPNDPGYSSLWGMSMIDAPGAWNVSTGSEEIVVAVIDTGIESNHEDLSDNIWTSDEGYHGYNALNDTYYPMDDHGHGTHVAGTIGAVGDNGLGVVGVNWNVSLMGIKFLDAMGGGTIGHAIAGLEYVLEKKNEGENIVATSNSWGGGGYSQLLYEAIEQHQEAGILFVAAAGNSGTDNDVNPMYPASYDLTNIISVAATNINDERAWFSNFGASSVHVGAPGVDINSTFLDNSYNIAAGTSMAAPHVSGLAALLASHNSSYDYNNLKNVIMSSVEPNDSLSNITLTEGRINASGAMTLSPDPDNIRFWLHQPSSTTRWGRETGVVVSLTDGVNPILEANVSVDFSSEEGSIFLEDDGTGDDQMADDGYYSGGWVPQVIGEVILTITATQEDIGLEITKNITVNVSGDACIALLNSEENALGNNTISHEHNGIILYASDSNEMVDNDISNCRNGIELYDSRYNIIENQMITNLEYGLVLDSSNDNYLTYNNLLENDVGILLDNSDNNDIHENTVSNNFDGIVLLYSNNNTIQNNDVEDNWYGILLEECDDNDIMNNEIISNDINLLIYMSDRNYIYDNYIYEGWYGLALQLSNRNQIHNNMVLNSRDAFLMFDSLKNNLVNNHMENGSIVLLGSAVEFWNTHNIDTSNLVNDMPVYYWKNETGGTVPTGAGQVILANCTGVTVENHNINEGNVGILMGFSNGNHIADNSVSNHTVGIYAQYSFYNEFMGNIALSNIAGIVLDFSDSNTVEDNTALNNDYGIDIYQSRRNQIIENNASFNSDGISLYFAEENTLSNNIMLSNSWGGVFFYLSAHNTITENIINWNENSGIEFWYSDGNNIIGNEVTENFIGIYLRMDSIENNVNGNNVSNNELMGITLFEGDGDRIENNTASDNVNGIYLSNCKGITITNNTMNNNGLHLGGTHSEHWNTHTMDNTNTVNEKPLYYWKNQNEGTVPAGAGQVILANCNGVTIENQNVSNGSIGILLGFSNHNTIKNNTASNNNYGIVLTNSNGNNIYHNNFIDNGGQAYDSGDNSWNVSYPLGGNHWSEWTEPDDYSGPGQDEPGSDGIVDNPYEIPGDENQDNYPWTVPNGWALEDPSIDLTYPTGGETLSTGSEEVITWNTEEGAGDIIGVDLEYSLDGGEDWNTIVNETEDSGSYTWTIPEETTTEAMVRATVHDDNNLKGVSTSGIFEITAAEFLYSDFVVEPTTVGAGENVTISLLVTNVGVVEGTEDVELKVEGEVVSTYEVQLDPNENRTVEFTWSEDRPGEYHLEVAQFVERVEVLEPAKFLYSHFSVDSDEVEPGRNVTVSVTVVNSGEMSGTETVELRVNDQEVDTHEVTFDPYQGDVIRFTWSEEEPGEYKLAVWSRSDGEEKFQSNVIVLKPAEFVYSDFYVEPTEVFTGEKVNVSVVVTNIGEIEGTEIVELKVDGEVADTLEIELAGDEIETGEFTWSQNRAGEYSLEIAQFSETVTVETEPGFFPTGKWIGFFLLLVIILAAIGILVINSIREKDYAPIAKEETTAEEETAMDDDKEIQEEEPNQEFDTPTEDEELIE